MMKPNTCLVIDTWEGQLEIDEAVLKANGVAGIGIRLNDMNGGHHMDTNFVRQWAEAVNFVRFPYFVYNPWVSGQANFDWLGSHMPTDCKSLAVDIEVRYSGITASKYATEVSTFLQLCKARGWKTIIYTGQGYIDLLSKWPDSDYWWAQYPEPAKFFGGVTTWDELKTRLDNLDKPFNLSFVPGTLKMWQFSGDYLTLPGNTRKMDVNLFYGSEDDLAAYFGNTGTIPTEPPKQTAGLYRIKDDIEAGIVPNGTRPYLRIGLPSTVRLRGGRGFVMLPAKWMSYIAKINTSRAYDYIFKPASGWHNTGNINRVEQLTFSGNIVEVTRIEDNRAYIKTVDISTEPPANAVQPTPSNLHTLIHLFTTQYKDHLDMTTDGRLPRIILAANPGEELWINTGDIAPYKPTYVTAKVTALPWLNVRIAPSTTAMIATRKLPGASVTIYETLAMGADLWGRIDGGWICLRKGISWYTTYRA